MAEKKGKSKTDVSARAEAKSKASICSSCGKKIDVVLSVSATGKRKMKRLCCGS